MTSSFYRQYIRSPQWQAKRKQALMHHGAKCAACGGRGRLQVHHLNYRHLGRENMSDLMILCQSCHMEVTKFHRKNRRRGLARNTNYIVARIRRATQKG